jgi:phage replication O-like protein O
MPKNDREILKADIEDGYTKIANLILEALALTNLNGKQMAICMFIMRRTYGWGITEDEITLEEIAQACNTDRPYASKMLKVLIDNKIIIRSNYMPGKTPNYGMNTRVAEWDKGCINVQQLQDYTIQGLYKYTTQGLHKYTTPEGTQDIEAQGPGTPPKERVKKGEINSGNTPPENGEKGEDEMPLLPEPIAKTLERYTPEQKEVVTQF